MNLVTGKMSNAEELDARAKAFYLIKKFSSLTFAKYSTSLYAKFLTGYENQLDSVWPNQAWLEQVFADSFLRRQIELDHGIDLLKLGISRESAFKTLVEGSRFSDYLWGMSAEYWGVEHDPFFVHLGRHEPVDTGLIALALLSRQNITLLGRTTLSIDRWTYSIIFDDMQWPPKRIYADTIPPCPEKNTSAEGEIVSGAEISTDGIWEPWLITGKVGCPNYFCKGQLAIKYKIEDSDEEHAVRWRLLWADDRHIDGSIPAEEHSYIKEVNSENVRLTVRAGEPCPRTGYWTSMALDETVLVTAVKLCLALLKHVLGLLFGDTLVLLRILSLWKVNQNSFHCFIFTGFSEKHVKKNN